MKTKHTKNYQMHYRSNEGMLQFYFCIVERKKDQNQLCKIFKEARKKTDKMQNKQKKENDKEWKSMRKKNGQTIGKKSRKMKSGY